MGPGPNVVGSMEHLACTNLDGSTPAVSQCPGQKSKCPNRHSRQADPNEQHDNIGAKIHWTRRGLPGLFIQFMAMHSLMKVQKGCPGAACAAPEDMKPSGEYGRRIALSRPTCQLLSTRRDPSQLKQGPQRHVCGSCTI